MKTININIPTTGEEIKEGFKKNWKKIVGGVAVIGIGAAGVILGKGLLDSRNQNGEETTEELPAPIETEEETVEDEIDEFDEEDEEDEEEPETNEEEIA